VTEDSIKKQQEKIPAVDGGKSTEELPDSWWHKIYLLVFIITVIVIAAMVWFTNHFSN
jgi:hypothetical protein